MFDHCESTNFDYNGHSKWVLCVYFRRDMSSNPKKAVKTSIPKAPKRQANKRPAVGGFFSRNKFAVLLFCFTFAVFGNAVFNGYALDDEFYTAGSNKLTQKGIKGIPEIFKSRTFYNNDGSGYSYRPIAVSSFALEIQFFGEKPRVSHFINVLLYAFTIVLLFGLLRKWFKAQGDWFAFFVALLFLVHPIHTEVVDNIKCRDELLSFFFGILMLRFIWLHIETGAKWTWFAIPLSFVLAGLSKTSVAPILALAPVAVWYFTDKKWWGGIKYALPVVAAIVILKIGVMARLPEMTRVFQGFENPLEGAPLSDVAATAFYVMGRYLWLHIIPYPLIFYYGLNEVPPPSWANFVVIASIVLYTSLAIWWWFEFRKKTITSFGLLWFVVCLSVFSNFFGEAPGLMAERFAYFASLGFVIVVADLVFRYGKLLPSKFEWKDAASSKVKWTFVTIAILFTLRSIGRNESWEDKKTLYRNDVELAPESAKINMLLGSLLSAQAAQKNYESQQLAMQGMQREAASKKQEAYALFNESRAYYEQATVVFPGYYTAWSNLGTAYYFVREYRKGIPYFKKALEIKKDYAEAYFNLGMTYEQLSLKDGIVVDTILLDSSVCFFRQGLLQDGKYASSADQLSRILMQHYGDSASAILVLNESAQNNPASDVPWNAMSNIYLKCGDTLSAVRVLEKAAELNPNVGARLRNLSLYFSAHGDQEKANYYGALFQKQQAEIERKQKMLGTKQK